MLGTFHVAGSTKTYVSNCEGCLGVGRTGLLVGLYITTKLQAEMFGVVKLDAYHYVSWTEVV